MAGTLQVGIIGVNAERGWAREAHVPAVQAVDGMELAAVATRSAASAQAAADRFGVTRSYGDPEALIAAPDIDVVTVAASVPAHRELITAALDAGKHVVTEWPVGTGTAQTAELAAQASAAGVHTAVGLQARVNPAVLRAGELIASGVLGRILSVTVHSSTAGFGRVVSEGELYLERPETGMNLTTIQTAHTLDLAGLLAGPLESLSALTTIQYPTLAVGQPARSYERTIADHVLVHGRSAGGGALAVQVVGGRPADDTPFRAEVVGESGVLRLDGGAARGFQAGVLTLQLDGEHVDVGDAALPAAVVNVAGVYATLRDDIAQGTRHAPSFEHALRLAHLVDDVLVSAGTGRRITARDEWPR